MTAFVLWQMTGYSLDLSESDIVWPGVIQGFGTGLVFVFDDFWFMLILTLLVIPLLPLIRPPRHRIVEEPQAIME